jgi:hypothetical protein
MYPHKNIATPESGVINCQQNMQLKCHPRRFASCSSSPPAHWTIRGLEKRSRRPVSNRISHQIVLDGYSAASPPDRSALEPRQQGKANVLHRQRPETTSQAGKLWNFFRLFIASLSFRFHACPCLLQRRFEQTKSRIVLSSFLPLVYSQSVVGYIAAQRDITARK